MCAYTRHTTRVRTVRVCVTHARVSVTPYSAAHARIHTSYTRVRAPHHIHHAWPWPSCAGPHLAAARGASCRARVGRARVCTHIEYADISCTHVDTHTYMCIQSCLYRVASVRIHVCTVCTHTRLYAYTSVQPYTSIQSCLCRVVSRLYSHTCLYSRVCTHTDYTDILSDAARTQTRARAHTRHTRYQPA
jgi:hypothetical protein